MSQILAVFGATGQQGSSLINFVLQDPELSQKYKIRAITRDVDSPKAKELRDKAKVEVVHGDMTKKESTEAALTGVHTVFAMTNPSFSPDGLEAEYNSGKTIADAAVANGAEYIIFSTLPSISKISGGKYTKVRHFDAKAKVEEYIRGLEIKSAFYLPGFFMANFNTMPFLAPQKSRNGDDTWVISTLNSPTWKVPMLDASVDTGKFIGAILAEPDKYEGKTFTAATGLYTMEQAAAIISKTTGKTVVFKQVSTEEWRDGLPFAPDVLVEAFSAPEEFGYFGGVGDDEAVAWAVENARGKLVTLEEFLNAHPVQLE